MRTLVLSILIAGMFALTSCKKDDTSTGPGTTSTTQNLSVPSVQFKGPSTTSTDPNAVQAKSTATMVNGQLAWLTAFGSLQAAQGQGGSSVWTFTGNGFSETLTGSKAADGSTSWSFAVNGTLGGQSYNNFTLWSGAIAADGRSGSWNLYQPNVSTPAATLTYSSNAQGVLTGTWTAFSSGSSVSGKYVILNNPDNSGSVEIYGTGGSVVTYKAVWTATGSGTWFTYDSTGHQTGTGTWS